MASAKEKCFRKAVDKLNEGREAQQRQKLDVKHEQGWVRDRNGSWSEASFSWELWASIRKTIRIMRGLQPEEGDRAANPVQFRKPDVTLTNPDGKKVVLDTKFTNANGKPDPWRDAKGMSNSKQKPDYQDINRSQGNDVGDEPKLDRDNCDCGKRSLETEKVQVHVPVTQPGGQLYFAPLPGLGGMPLPAPAPGPMPVPGFGGLVPVLP